MNKKIASILLGLTTLLALAGCEGTDNGAQTDVNGAGAAKEIKTYRIGVIAPMTGDAAAYGVEIQRILDYRLAEINDDYQEKDVKFELIYEDGKCDGAAAAAAFQKLTDMDGVKLIVGGGCSSESLGMAPLLEEKGALAISNTSSSPEIDGKSPNLFSLSYEDSLVGKEIGRELGKYRKIALITEQNDYNVAMKKVVSDVLAKEFPETQVVADESFPKGSTDLRNVLEKVNASDAEAVFLSPNAGVTAVAMARQLAEIKSWNKIRLCTYAMLGQDVLDAAPETLEGTLSFDAPNINNEEFKAYTQKIVEANGTLDNLGSYYSASTLDAINLLTVLTVKYDGDAAKIRDALATGRFSGWISPTVYFDNGTFVKGIGVARYVVKDGQLQLQ